MMYQYKIFLMKEFKHLLNNKKLILLSIFAVGYAPLCNYFAANNLLSLSYAVPLLLLLGTLFPSEITYSIMKNEYETKADEILRISPMKPQIVILSKITIPVILSIVTLCLSGIINEIMAIHFDHMYHGFMNAMYIIMVIFNSIWSSLLLIYVLEKEEKAYLKNVFTGILALQFIVYSILYTVYYVHMAALSIMVSLLFSYIMLKLCLHNYNNKQCMKSKTNISLSSFVDLSRLGVLIKDGYCHVWNYKKTIGWILFCMISFLGCTSSSSMLSMTIYVYVFLSVSLCNYIIYPSTIQLNKASGLLHVKMSCLNYHCFLLTRLLFTFAVNFMISLLCFIFTKQSLMLMLQINLFNCLCIYLFFLEFKSMHMKSNILFILRSCFLY